MLSGIVTASHRPSFKEWPFADSQTMISVKWPELIDAFYFSSVSGSHESGAFIDLHTGTIYCVYEDIELEEEIPDDLETSDRYLPLPHKNDLDLGRKLALSFIEQYLPEEFDRVTGYFRKRGAYSRFKELLADRGALDNWYAFENKATETALRQWCADHDISVIPPATGDTSVVDRPAEMPTIREMTIGDYAAVIEILRHTSGVRLREADFPAAVQRYLERNPGLSFVAEESGELVACIMSGHDGRRGYLQHLAVLPTFRRRGIGRALVQRCIERLASVGILKSHVDVLVGNESAAGFWSKLGWEARTDIQRFSFIASGGKNV
jgi:ribosomal protein S18 acetylase RimI-like enzyme